MSFVPRRAAGADGGDARRLVRRRRARMKSAGPRLEVSSRPWHGGRRAPSRGLARDEHGDEALPRRRRGGCPALTQVALGEHAARAGRGARTATRAPARTGGELPPAGVAATALERSWAGAHRLARRPHRRRALEPRAARADCAREAGGVEGAKPSRDWSMRRRRPARTSRSGWPGVLRPPRAALRHPPDDGAGDAGKGRGSFSAPSGSAAALSDRVESAASRGRRRTAPSARRRHLVGGACARRWRPPDGVAAQITAVAALQQVGELKAPPPRPPKAPFVPRLLLGATARRW